METLRIEVYEDGNFTKILETMMANPNFQWFEKVKTIKCYLIRDMKDKTVLQTFFTKFRNLEMIKGVIEEEFNFLEGFQNENKHVPCISVTHPETDELRNKLTQFLQYNKGRRLHLYGGTIDQVKLDTSTVEGLTEIQF